MENYKLKQRLGKGGQGSVYLAENKTDGRTYVLKKVECNDESEANKAFKEAMALQELQHPYVCGYKEFFVTWDKEESAMFVCIVMDYYQNGDLDRVLKQKRSKKAHVEELVIKKWLGQIIEALVFVHQKQVIHRDLKPSNIFMKEDLSVVIGDFGVATIMNDARTKTRTTVGSMNWMAPEVLERPYDERSDIWSAGCIVLEMCTCSLYDTQDIHTKLFAIKQSPKALEDILNEAGKMYSQELLSVIRTMLRHQRPTSIEMCDITYVQEAMALSGSDINKKKQDQAKKAGSIPLPRDQGINPVVEYLSTNSLNEVCVQNGLEYLAELTKQEGTTLDAVGKQLVARLLRDNVKNASILTAGFSVLQNLIVTATNDDILYTSEIVSIIPLSMKTNATNKELQQVACSLVAAMSSVETAAEVIGNVGGVQDILAAMRAFHDSPEIVCVCCSALWSLAVNETNAQIVSGEKGMHDVCQCLEEHKQNVDVVESAAAAIISLSLEDENLEQVAELDCVALLLTALKNHPKHAKVTKNVFMALASLVEPDEESAYRVLKCECKAETFDGLPIILAAYKNHRDNAEVVENFCSLMMELCEYDEIRIEIKDMKMDEALKEIHKRFRENEDIMKPCGTALSLLSGDKNVQRPVSARMQQKH